jgi:thiosulfate/3-mercaptopyruvate sulfurtransferase
LSSSTLVDARTLHAHLDDPSWLIVDCRHSLADFAAGRTEYDAGHIPGAFFADIENDLSGEKTGSNGRHPLPDREAFAAFLRGLGSNDATQIVAYDAGADMFSSRLWFLARWIGHADVAVLDGGISAWKQAWFALTADRPAPRPAGTLTIREPLDGVLDIHAIHRDLRSDEMLLLDARSPERYRGEIEPVDPFAGHIPGARNRFFKHNFDEDGRWKPPEQLRDELGAHGDPAQIVHYCGSGVSAAANLLAMKIAKLDGARLYSGSWSEWCADPSRPIEVS